MFKIFRKINKSSDKSLRSKGTARLVSGFTLIEIMVSISIFSIVMLIVIGALLMLSDANKKAQAMRAVVDNLNFAMDDMTRSIRTGKDFKCGLSVNNGSVSGTPVDCIQDNVVSGIGTIGFTGMQQEKYGEGVIKQRCYVYSYEPGSAPGSGSISYGTTVTDLYEACPFSEIKMSTFVSPEVEVAGLKYYVFDYNTTTNVNQVPVVIIVLSGDINIERYKFKTPFNIQTTVSQRGSSY